MNSVFLYYYFIFQHNFIVQLLFFLEFVVTITFSFILSKKTNKKSPYRFSSCSALSIISSKAQNPHISLKELHPFQWGLAFPRVAGNGYLRTSLHHSVGWAPWEICQLPIILISLWKRIPSFNWIFCHLL